MSTDTINTKEFITIKEAQKLTNLSYSTIRNAIYENELPAFREGKKLIFIDKCVFEKWYKNRTKKVTKEDLVPFVKKSKTEKLINKERTGPIDPDEDFDEWIKSEKAKEKGENDEDNEYEEDDDDCAIDPDEEMPF